MITKHKRPAWVRDARKAIAAHLPAIRKAMAEAAEPHELAIVPRGVDWEDCVEDNAAAAKQMLHLVQQLNDMARAAADAVAERFSELVGQTWDGEDLIDSRGWSLTLDEAVAHRWREAINELPERDDV